MYKFPHGTEELEGIANRTDFDLGSHTKNQKDYSLSATVLSNDKSNSKLAINDPESKEWVIPYVIELDDIRYHPFFGLRIINRKFGVRFVIRQDGCG